MDNTKFLYAMSKAANIEQGLINLEFFLSNNPSLENIYEKIETLMVLFSSSQYLTEIFFREIDFLLDCLENNTLTIRRELKISQSLSPEDAIIEIRKFKNREILRIGLLDLIRLIPPADILKELSILARNCIHQIYKVWEREMREKHGEPVEELEGRTQRSRFTILGMGKLGGNELNFSSDVDLIYVYSLTQGKTVKSGITNHEYFLKLGRLITSSIQKITADGMMYIVDLGLRPGGKDGEIAISIDSAEIYYESWGQTWERQAMIKVDCVGGDESLGKEFSQMIKPFVYRKSIDFGDIEKVREMKRKINKHISKRGDDILYNVKLGKGGIREIEFIAQTFQLLFGGKKEALQTKSTLGCVKALKKEGLVSDSDAAALSKAYIFLREVENRIQMNNGNQEHRLPKSFEERVYLGRKMKFFCVSPEETEKKFMEEYKKHTEIVQSIYNAVLESSTVFVDKKGHSEEVEVPQKADFEEKIFDDPQKAKKILEEIRNGISPFEQTSEKSKLYFDRLKPEILKISTDLPEPDIAIVNFDKYVSTYGATETLLGLLVGNINILKLLLELFGRSEFLTRIICLNPELIETLLLEKALYEKKGKEDILKELSKALEDQTNVQSKFLKYKMSEELRIGLQSILNINTLRETFLQLSNLADAVLSKALELSLKKVSLRFGIDPVCTNSCGLSLLAAGKLGGKELDFASDLDIFLVFKSGKLPDFIYPQEFYIRVCQELSNILSRTAEKTYHLDMDLRPDGSQGMLVCELSHFDRYYQERGETWERQAMIRSRFIAGDSELGEKALCILQNFSYSHSLPAEKLKRIKELRQEMKKQRGHEFKKQKDLKFGFGGLTELEFTVQTLQLFTGEKNIGVRKTNTFEAIESLFKNKVLEEEEFFKLREGYLFLRKIETSLRIIHDRPVNTFNVSEKDLRTLARRLNMKDSENVLKTYQKHTQNVHGIYNKVIVEQDSQRVYT